MSLLTKIFIILVFMAALVALGVQTTLFSHRVDWKAKWVQELNHHYQTIGLKNSEIAYWQMEVANRKDFINALNKRIDILVHEKSVQESRIADLDRLLIEKIFETRKLHADLEAYTRNLEAQMVQLKDKEMRIVELRDKVAKEIAAKNVAAQELMYVKQELERFAKDLANLEERHVSTVKVKRRLEEQLEELERRGFDISFGGVPLRPVDGKVMTYSAQAGVAIVNQGKDHGVMLGMKFTIYRGNQFVATAVVKEAAREWSAIQIDLKHNEPMVGDDASNHILLSATRPPPGR
jgi:hypothetical protein